MARNTALKIAKAAGYYIAEGAYRGTTDDRLGRWYVGHETDDFFRPYGAGHPTRAAAWRAAAKDAARVADENARFLALSADRPATTR